MRTPGRAHIPARASVNACTARAWQAWPQSPDGAPSWPAPALSTSAAARTAAASDEEVALYLRQGLGLGPGDPEPVGQNEET